MTFNITVNEEQLKLIIDSLEAKARAGVGQWEYALENLFMGFRKLPYNDKRKVEEVIKEKTHPNLELDQYYGISNKKVSKLSKQAYDMFQVLNYEYKKNKKIKGIYEPMFITKDKPVICKEI